MGLVWGEKSHFSQFEVESLQFMELEKKTNPVMVSLRGVH